MAMLPDLTQSVRVQTAVDVALPLENLHRQARGGVPCCKCSFSVSMYRPMTVLQPDLREKRCPMKCALPEE